MRPGSRTLKVFTPRRFGDYELLERLSLGGTAEVFRARATVGTRAGSVIALKRLLPHVDEDAEAAQRFLDEARLAAKLEHPGIGRVLDWGVHRGSHFLAMELLEGGDLGRLTTGMDQPAGPLVAAAIGAQLGDGLDYLHGLTDAAGQPLGVVHRDVSPRNIFMAREGRVVLVDFGSARYNGRQSETTGGVVRGKHGYMSPEQVRGEALDGRTDIFSLGVVLWELVMGRRLFRREGEALLTTLERVESAQVPSLIGCPAELAAAIMSCLARNKEDRPMSARRLAEAANDTLGSQGRTTHEVAAGFLDRVRP